MASQKESFGQEGGHNHDQIYEGRVFLIKDIKRLAKLYALKALCVDCRACFTQTCHLQQHAHKKTCSQGRAIINCSNEWVEAQQTTQQSQ